ncbi:DUF4350 domain-containing protein [Rufibacter glacialis]|uniref:DUF4350 domain-containing protein n=1 Tax=Rufibacter glacialis TaxID=1259555 RepID=A0A5M8Q4X2_9BACT|nr:DUF4350 domain-containing protein [Rufibacter glacialis]KAA6430181.1 DUF4350 domain-containing protein [Rufibacter glacialis]GGK87095.1 hypothetical protein GCM10011405_38550 [Rufibacter glacialis]
MKGYRFYALLLGVLFTGFVVVEYYRPKPIDWKETFSNKDKIPYGTYVLFDLLPDLFPGQPVTPVRLPVMNQVEEEASQKQPTNYVFVNASFRVDSLDLRALLTFVGKGNNAFISAHSFSRRLQDTLGFTTETSPKDKGEALGLTFTHPQLQKNKPVLYAWAKVNHTLVIKAGTQARVLGQNTTGDANFVQIPFGKGSFFLHSAPMAFTNYHVPAPTQTAYASQALSHLPVQAVWWDEYQKQGPVGDKSVFRVLLSHEPLAWAYYITLAGLLLFVLFESKRTQRIIPVWEKPRNTTLEFVRVMGNLYFNYRDHGVIAEKKINYFLEYLRLHYHETTNVLDEELQERVAAKSGVALSAVAELFRLIHYARAVDRLKEQPLWQLNKHLESFYRQASR